MIEDDYKAEIGRLTKERDELFLENGKLANTLGADNLRLFVALKGAMRWLHPFDVMSIEERAEYDTVVRNANIILDKVRGAAAEKAP